MARRLALPLLALLALAPLALAADGEAATVGVRERGYDLAFDPARVEVGAGETVTFRPDRLFAHTLTAEDGSFDTGRTDPGQSSTFEAPAEAGEYAFVCSFHPQMVGTLVVTGEAAEESGARPVPAAAAPLAALAVLGAVALLASRRR